MSGTLTAAATITAAIKDVKVNETGYSGLMLPILEDTRWRSAGAKAYFD